MKHTLAEINELKGRHIEMWNLVESQVDKSFKALLTFDKELAHQVVAREKVVNAQELVVDHHCENFIALFAPVAVDLRFIISMLKINNNLERIGDFAESIALFVLYQQQSVLDEQLVKNLQLVDMTSTANEMLLQTRIALQSEDSAKASVVLAMDDKIDKLNRQATEILAQYMAENSDKIVEMLNLHSIIRRIERVGDRVSNIAEDIVFFVDAKELRHTAKK